MFELSSSLVAGLGVGQVPAGQGPLGVPREWLAWLPPEVDPEVAVYGALGLVVLVVGLVVWRLAVRARGGEQTEDEPSAVAGGQPSPGIQEPPSESVPAQALGAVEVSVPEGPGSEDGSAPDAQVLGAGEGSAPTESAPGPMDQIEAVESAEAGGSSPSPQEPLEEVADVSRSDSTAQESEERGPKRKKKAKRKKKTQRAEGEASEPGAMEPRGEQLPAEPGGAAPGQPAVDAAGEGGAEAREVSHEAPVVKPAGPKFSMSTSRSLGEGLAKTKKEGFIGRLARLFKGRQALDEELIERVEEVLYKADIGVRTTESLVEKLQEEAKKGKGLAGPDGVWSFLKQETIRILDIEAKPFPFPGDRPLVIMVVGVNGVGKTTTIGKIGARFTAEGKRVLLAAGDTFRAAAVEQLEVWADRIGTEIVKGRPEADPASVVYSAIQKGIKDGYDVVIADTAGRLHTKVPLMDELKKIHRVCGKAAPGAPDEVLLVLDSTNGQNAIHQARQFSQAIGLTGIVLTKLDGTAKGGIILGISDEFKLPIRFIGIGEQIGDLRPFDPSEFVEALFEGVG